MPTQNNSLRGLPGLNTISEQERQAFMLNNAEKLKQYRSPGKRKRAAEILYNNQQFINQFGQEEFDRYNNGTQEAYDFRNNLLREKVIGDAFDAAYKPVIKNGKVDNMTGAGEEWDRISDLSTDAKEKLLNSEWKTPAQRKKEQEDRNSWYEKAVDFVAGEAIQQYKKESNQKILDRIYNDDADSAASQQSSTISQAYLMPEITGASDKDTKKKFYEAITPSNTNMGIPEYASRWGDGSDPSSEMEDFSIDDMRQVLAKKYVYDRTMSPMKAQTALNNEAKRYIKQHQGSLKRLALFGKDVLISAMSYTADKVNGIYNLALATEDWLGDKPEVYVGDQGEILDPSKTKIMRDPKGNLFYQDGEGKIHSVHQEQIDRRTLHNMGKNEDGSEAEEGIFHLNPLYWTRAEQFGTLDSAEQKQYEKLGSSPYKVAYNPNDESDLVYESFKMMSFGLADAASMLIPFGVGTAGKVLSTAGNIGKIGRGMGKAMETTGKYLSAQSRVGQVAQGLAGAGGIAYAYQRGAFQETLAQNLANAEEANLNLSKQEIFDRYNNDKQYRAQVDAMVTARATKMKQEYLAQARSEGQQIADESALDKMLMARASDAVHNELVAQKAQENKDTQAYADLQQEAIQSAGDAAWTSFLPEAIKYGLVNTIGFRKFLYTNPQGLKKSVSGAMKGMKEITTKEGRQRLATEATEFGTLGAKAKKAGKIIGSQFWGGAWTNGTDDMMVDAAERINEDSFNRYLKAYENGEALADEYGLIDGLYSYWKGLNNSLGQETTRNAAAVGGFGSLVSASPNMANIAHLATKEGREAYKNRYQKRPVYETDENGFKTLKKDENGNPVMEDISLSENWRERAAFFIQNGVLNNYYGAKQNERDLQNHADYVNGILDRYDDFKGLQGLIASDIERQNAETIGDEKTMRFIHAFESINALNQLKKDKNDALKFSSVVDNAMSLLDSASKLGTEESTLSDEQMADLVKEYYKNNPGVEQSDENHQIALSHIAHNAQKMKEAYEAFNEANNQVSNYEQDRGITIAPVVKHQMSMFSALSGHWQDRIETMKDEIGDTSSATAMPEGEALIATYGGIKNAKSKLKEYEIGSIRQVGEKQWSESLSEAVNNVSKRLDEYNEAQKKLRNAGTSEARYEAEQEVNKARTEYENAVEQKSYIQDKLATLQDKKKRLQEAIEAHESLSKEEKGKVLTADEIMALDPISRARMMNPLERVTYSNAQEKQIRKLEEQLKKRDKNGDPLQKIQDIAILTQNIAQADDAYNRLSRNPDAAALQMEKQTVEESEKAYNLINQRNAQTLANTVQELSDGLKVHKDIKKDAIDDIAFRMLRKHNPTLLDIIDSQEMLPQHQTQIAQAKEWSKAVSDIDAVINNSNETDDWKAAVSQDVDAIIDAASDTKGILSRLESVVDGNASRGNAQDFEKVLTGLVQLGYHRNATVLENRRARKEREEADKKKREEEQRAAQEAAQKAMEESTRKLDLSEADKDASKQKQMDLESADTLEDFDLGEDAAFESKAVKPEEKGKSYIEGKKFYEKIMNSEEPNDSKVAANFTTIEAKAERGEITAEEAWEDVKKWNPDINETEAKAAIDYIIEKKASRNKEVRQRAKEKAEKELGFHPGDVIQDGNGRKYTVQGYDWTGIEGDNKDIFVSSTIAGEPVIVLKDSGGTIIRDSAGDFYHNWKERRIQNWTKVDSPKSTTEPAANSPLDILVGWAEGRIEGKEAIEKLDGTEYVKHTKGNKALGTTDGVHLSNKVETDLGKYLISKYPFLKVEGVSVATGVSTFGGNMGLTVVKDADGNEYGTPSNFIRSLAKGGKAAEVVRKGLEKAAQDSVAKGITPSLLMGDDAESGSLDYGEMWTGSSTPEQGTLTVKRETIGKVPVVTFSIDGKPTSLEVTPDEYIMTKDAEEKNQDSEKKPFNVKSIERIDEDWFFEGNFAGQIDNTTVKVSKKFDLDKALDRQRGQREDAALSKGVTVSDSNLVDDGKQVSAKAVAIEQQTEPEDSVMDLSGNDEAETENEVGIQNIENSPVTLSGNALYLYNYDDLKNFILNRRKGSDLNDALNHFFAWLDLKGIKLQNIIDTELPKILELDKHRKVKFMSVQPEAYGTKVGNTTVQTGNNINNHLFLVVDYDSDVQSVHNEDNGGVIKTDGKKYLIIGTVGYGNINTNDAAQKAANIARRDKYNTVLQIPGKDSATIRNNNSYNNGYRVLEGVTTEIVPGSMIPGYIVKQLEGEGTQSEYTISDLLKMENEREGTSLSLQDLKWGIQEYSKFLAINESSENIMKPGNVEGNVGAAFVLIPAGNGKYLPIHLFAKRYSELRDSILKDRVSRLLSSQGLLARGKANYPVRHKALIELLKIFYLDAENNDILLGKNDTNYENKITLVNANGDIVFSEYLTDNFDEAAFLDAFSHKFNPRINITAATFRDMNTLQEFDEAGALTTDAAMLHTTGVSYSIYPVDASGKMIVPETISNKATIHTEGNTYRSDRNIVYYNGVPYEYKSNNTYSYNGKIITEDKEPTLFKTLEFNRSIATGKRTANYNRNGYNYYIMREGEHPQVVREDVHHILSELSEEESAKIIKEQKALEEAKKRAEAAKAEMEAGKQQEKTAKEGQANHDDTGNVVLDEKTGMIILEEGDTSTDTLVKWAEGKITTEEAIELLKDTDYVRYHPERKAVGLNPGRKAFSELTPKKEQALGEYITKKYPNLTVEGMHQDTGFGTLGQNLLIVKDIDGIEYGTPSNFLNSLAKGGRALEAISKQKKETGVSKSSAEDSSAAPAVSKPSDTANTQTFEALMKKRKYKNKVYEMLAEKWPELEIDLDKAQVPSNEELRKFLEDKGANGLDSIGASEDATQAWIDYIKECL